MRGRFTRGLVVRAFVLCVGVWLSTAAPSLAQSSIPPPETYNPIDGNGVDVSSGSFEPSTTAIAIGPEGDGLTYQRSWDTSVGGFRDNAVSGIQHEAEFTPGHQHDLHTYTVVVLGRSTVFLPDGGTGFVPAEGANATLTKSGSTWTFTDTDGSVAVFSEAGALSPYKFNEALLTTLTRPNGTVLTFTYNTITYPNAVVGKRLQSITSSLGYQLHFEYGSNSADADWERMVAARAINNAVDYCNPSANTCSLSQSWPTLTFGTATNEINITDSLSRVTRWFTNGNKITGVRWPTRSSGNSLTITYGDYDGEHVVSVNNGDGTWNYDYNQPSDPDLEHITTITDPLSRQTVVQSHRLDVPQPYPTYPTWRLTHVTNALSQTTVYSYSTSGSNYGRLASIQFPEGNRFEYAYDARGNLTSRIQRDKAGTGTITMSATYPTACNATYTPVMCNQPSSFTDGRGNVTNFTYSTTHGGVLTMTSPSVTVPGVGSVQPQTRNDYAQVYAWYKNSGGSIVQAAAPVWRQIESSQCTVSSSCNGQASEVQTTTTYQNGNSSNASNVLPLTVSNGAGDASLTATVATAWTNLGDPATVTDPLSNVTTYGYDAMRQRLGELAAGSGARPATRTSYDADGQVTNVERGSATALTSAGAFTSFSALENTATTYDQQRRKTRDTFSIGGVAQRVTQYTYDDANQLDCTAIRMNPAVFGSLPSSACSLGTTGSNGPDRISHNEYDAVGRVTTEWRAWQITTANGFPQTLQQQYARYTYSNNGQRLSVRDANDNRSAYVYDGFDRLCRLYFPVTTLGANAANTGGIAEGSLTCSSGGTNPDYEGYSYDNNNNRTGLRLRSTETISYTYDALNRETVKDIPGGTSADVYSGYDLLGRRLYGRFTSTSGNGIVYTYDALARVLTEQETWNSRTISYQYDLAGNRTRVTYPDSNYIQFTFDVLNRMDQVRENGATSGAGLLGDYTYDLLSRPTNLAFGNGTSTSLTYDTDSQDWSYTQDLVTATPNQDVTVAFTRNASAQTLTRNLSNALYDYDAGVLSQSYTRNGLNQYTAVGGATFTNDTRGNLTNDGVRAFCYDLENRLQGVAPTATNACTTPSTLDLEYDPLGRLRTTYDGTNTTTFLYSGDQLVAEYNNAGQLLRRYAFGAGVDRPLIWYEGSGLTTRNTLYADELGSIIATSDGSTNRVYTYSPYGEPQAWNSTSVTFSRFRYTGQITLDANLRTSTPVRLYHYKARVYDPGIGRFLQTDPIGYEDDLNLYAYVRNDPLNNADPTGTECDWCRDFGRAINDVIQATVTQPIQTYVTEPTLEFGRAGAEISRGEITPQNMATVSTYAATMAVPEAMAGRLAGAIEGTAVRAAPDTGALAARAGEIHGALDPIAARMRTTAVVETAEGGRFVGSSENALSRGQQAVLQPGETAARGPGHAEITAADAAQAAGQTPVAVGASRAPCPECQVELTRRGIRY